MHVYDWLDEPPTDPAQALAKEWLEQFVKPAYKKDHPWLDARALTCEYRGKRYRCVGASTMGDVWLTTKLKKPDGYELRVEITECAGWEREDAPDAPAPDPHAGEEWYDDAPEIPTDAHLHDNPTTDCRIATAEGWCLMNVKTEEGVTYGDIQRDDDSAAFVHDHEAVKHVREKARKGSPYHQKAITIHDA